MQHLAVHVLAAEPTINTTGVVAWIVKYIIPLLFAFAAVANRCSQCLHVRSPSSFVGLKSHDESKVPSW